MSTDALPVPAPALASVAALTQQVHDLLDWAADVDEIAAILESRGINDRVAGDYGHSSVFALARQILSATDRPEAVALPPARLRTPVAGALVRAGLYLTPTVVAIGTAPLVGALPWYATTGLLVVGWGSAQALAYLGYQAVNEAGVVAAARRLALGFAALAAAWTVLLAASGASAMSYLVSAAQVMVFAANTAALVTGTERRTLVAAAGCWLATAGLALGAGRYAVPALLASLCAMVAVAYLPAWGRSGGRWRPDLGRCGVAAGHGVVGTGQAVLFVLVVLQQAGTVAPAMTSAPLLVGVPMTELLLLRHQRRVADSRARLADRAHFRRHLARAGHATGLALAVPLLAGGLLVVTGPTPLGWAVAASTLLAGINALCLVLVAHQRPAIAAGLVWTSAVLIAVTASALPSMLPAMPVAVTIFGALIMLCLYPFALIEAVSAMKSPWSYR